MSKVPMYQKIYDDILTEIKDGTYKEGDLLPSESAVASKYGVSRITAKQAMNMLAGDNLIVRKPGKGSIVISSESGNGRDPGNVGNISSEKLKALSNRGKVICVIFDSFDFAFGCDLLQGIEWECTRKGFQVLFQCTYGSIDYEKEVIRNAADAGVAGMIIMCVQNEVFDEQILRLVLNDFPVILVDRNMPKIQITCVGTDNYTATKELTELLIKKGHRNISFATHVYHDTSTIRERMKGFSDAMTENGILSDESDWLTTLKTGTPLDMNKASEIDQEDHDEIVNFVSRHPDTTAYFALNYKVGTKMILVLRELGLENKTDVVFFDGPEPLVIPRPYYARVLQGEMEIGEKAVDLLEERINGGKTENQVYVPYRIVRN